MLKLALLSTVACLLLAGIPRETRGGMLPSLDHSQKYFFYHMYQKAIGRCYGGDDVKREYDDQLRTFFGKCFGLIATSSEDKESANKNSTDDGKAAADGEATTQASAEKDLFSYYTADITRALKNDVLHSTKLIGCLFDQYNITVSENGTVDGSSYIATFNENPKVSEELKSFLIPGMKDCERKSVFGNYMIWGEKYANFHKMLHFYRCTNKEIYGACIKQDLKNSASEYDLSGLDGELSDVDDITRRYFIASGYANWDRTGIWDNIF